MDIPSLSGANNNICLWHILCRQKKPWHATWPPVDININLPPHSASWPIAGLSCFEERWVGWVGEGGWYQSMLCWLLPYSILLAKGCCAEAGAWRVSMEQEKATHTPEVSNFPPKRLLACLLRDHTSQWPLLTASPSNGSFHLYALKIDTLPRHVQHILWRIWYSTTYTWLWTDNNVQFKFICKTKCQSKKYKKKNLQKLGGVQVKLWTTKVFIHSSSVTLQS